jgi:hypothetical protein
LGIGLGCLAFVLGGLIFCSGLSHGDGERGAALSQCCQLSGLPPGAVETGRI